MKELFSVIEAARVTERHGKPLDLAQAAEDLGDLFIRRRDAGKIIALGNGGSAAIASHTVNDLCKNCRVPALCFSDYALLTCLANDCGYENAYKEAVNLMADVDDIIIAISSSGKSANILNAAEAALNKGCYLLTLSGFDGDNPLRKMGDVNVYIPSPRYGLVEMSHQAILHMITDRISELFQAAELKK
ncbi:MAG: SIS domain-containing protein [Syntrophomonadaceae bacterium]|jgi:D-sedoheptulose 7-phosphate isomerase|nr:SIS domain-containing protein [Syntrophomonadaceae bacterium]